MSDTDLFEGVSSATICREGWQDVADFHAGGPHDDSHILEMFRRAVIDHDQLCWQELYAMLHDQILIWSRSAGIAPHDDPEETVAMAWEKFWRSYGPEQLAAAAGARSVLAYLKLAALSVGMDHARQRARDRLTANLTDDQIEDVAVSEDTAEDCLERAELWAIVAACLRDDRERTLVHLRYELELKSADVQRQRPDLFPTVADVYNLTRSIIDRLRRNPVLRQWFEGDAAAD